MTTFHERAHEARNNAADREPDTDDYGSVATFICAEHGIYDLMPWDSTLCPTCRRGMRLVVNDLNDGGAL